MSAPSLDELRALARRAATLAGGEALASATWERSLHACAGYAESHEGLAVAITCRRDGRAATVRTTAVDDDRLVRAAHGAATLAATAGAPACGPLATPSTGRAHDGWDPAVVALDPAHVAAALSEPAERDHSIADPGPSSTLAAPAPSGAQPGSGPSGARDDPVPSGARPGSGAAGERLEWWAGAARIAIASGAGEEVAEQRTVAIVEARAWREGRTARAVRAAVSPAALDAGAVAEEAREWLGAGRALAAPPGEHAVVLGPLAVAAVLDRLRDALTPAGKLGARRGERVVAPSINLSDSPRFPGSLPRSYDAAGTPRQPVPLIQDGVAHRSVSPASGHAADAAGRTAAPEHLVLVGGGASDLEELLAPLRHGLLVCDLDRSDRASGLFLVENGRRAAPLRDAVVRIDPLALLAGTQALTAHQWLVPSGARSARVLGATLAPALRTTGGLTVQSGSGWE